jgi:hypothetical protein
MFEAMAVSQMARVFILGLILPQLNHQTAIKVDFKKKASVASMARREPKTSPTYSE